jgi:SulP family sulfate permease
VDPPSVPPKPEVSLSKSLIGDAWGGVAATLVALPAAIAFGVAVYGPIGGAGVGALAGLVGATALGSVAPLLGGTPKLISAPCAPAVAVMSAFAVQASEQHGRDPAHLMILMTLVGLAAAALQVLLGIVRAGTIIKYIPYPVVTGYLSGVGVVIFLKQLPALLGLPQGVTLADGLAAPSTWQWPALAVAAVTIVVMVGAPRLTKAIPGAILGLAAGVVAYFALSFVRPDLRTLGGNHLVIGPLGGEGAAFFEAFRVRLSSLGSIDLADARSVLVPATTLAVLLSLDTLKTCVVVDAMTGGRHESNRELFGQGVANGVSALLGGMAGSGTSGPTLVNIASGAQTRWSAVMEGALVLVVFLLLGNVVAWAPLAALAGILVVVAFRMFDWSALRWARRRATGLDFAVVAVVIGTAVFVDLISASAVGVALSILLFIRNESRGAVIHRKLFGDQILSKQRRLPAQVDVLTTFGKETVVVELAGSLFFGTTDQLRGQLERELRKQRTIIFDMRRVDAVDLTAVHILEQMRTQLRKRDADMVFCNVPKAFAGRKDAAEYLREVGLFHPEEKNVVFDQLTDALAWAEDRILTEHGAVSSDDSTMELLEMPMFQGRKPETLATMAGCIEKRRFAAGEIVFHHGEEGDEIFFVGKGSVRISLALEGKSLHVASFGKGDFFGEITFLDGGCRTADAIAETETTLFAVSRKRFDGVASAHPRLGQALFSGLARTLALRLRQADREISTLEEA